MPQGGRDLAMLAALCNRGTMLDGFQISHFRNFDEEPQIIAPLGKLNVFIGSNNSGKSNILRYVRDILVPSLNDFRGQKAKLTQENVSRFAPAPPSYFTVYFPSDDEALNPIVAGRNENQTNEFYKTIRSLPAAIEAGNLLPISILRQAQNQRDRVFTHEQDWEALDSAIMNQISERLLRSHRTPKEIGHHIETHLVQNKLSAPETVYVPAFRQIKTRLDAFKNEYEEDTNSSDHIIDELVKFSNPTFDQQDNKKSFIKLRNFVREITLIDDLEIDIPHDRSTVNVEIDGYKRPIETLGSGVHELFMLASQIVLNEGKIVLLEEPELHMHPEFQRKLLNFILNNVEGQFFVTTHSPAIIDIPEVKVFGVRNENGRARVETLIRNQRRHNICREIGYRPSDLLQANCVIWVEGPSDRIYLNYWLHRRNKNLKEGIDYSIMFYGGKLLSHLNVDDSLVNDFISLLPINRHPAIIMDSDIGTAGQAIRPTKERVKVELEAIGGHCWVTDGREVENYVPRPVREASVKAVHSKAECLTGAQNRFGKPLNYRTASGKEITRSFDKISIARKATEIGFQMDELSLEQRLDDLIHFIEVSNRA